MKPLNQKATHIFRAILSQLGGKSYVKIANSTVYTPLSVDRLGADMVALAHNTIQNGDVMADPDMTFWLAPDGLIYPCTYQNSYAGVYQEAATITNGRAAYKPRMQAQLAAFANQWMRNIDDQQDILEKKAASKSGKAPQAA